MNGQPDSSTAAEKTILIVGAGCTGLALAQGLKKAGISSIIFEREPAHLVRARDWNMGLHWGSPILKSLIPPESFEKLASTQVDPNHPLPEQDTIKFLHGETGEQIGATTIPHIYRLRRSKLRAVILEGLEVRYDKVLTNVSYEGDLVTAHFADGTSATGAILIGADGARSDVRNYLCGPEEGALEDLPYGASIVQASYPAEQAKFLRSFHPLYIASPHPQGMFSWVGLHDSSDAADPESWVLNHYISWPCPVDQQTQATNEERMIELKGKAKLFAEPFKSAFLWLKDDHPIWYSPLKQWDPSLHSWDNRGGRVTIAGDAAHPMTFQRGQGLNNAIADAAQLTKHITAFIGGEKTKQEAINEYEIEMKDRAGTEVRLSCANTRMVHVWDQVMHSPIMTKGFSKGDGAK